MQGITYLVKIILVHWFTCKTIDTREIWQLPFWNEVGGDLSLVKRKGHWGLPSCKEEELPSSRVSWFHRVVSSVKLSRNRTVGGVEWFECWVRRQMGAKSKLQKCSLYLHPFSFFCFNMVILVFVLLPVCMAWPGFHSGCQLCFMFWSVWGSFQLAIMTPCVNLMGYDLLAHESSCHFIWLLILRLRGHVLYCRRQSHIEPLQLTSNLPIFC